MHLTIDDHVGTRAIAMWDFSWLERRGPGEGFQDWGQALDGLVERGYDVIRIDVYPHLLAHPDQSHELLPIWDQHTWGSPTPLQVEVWPALVEFLGLVRERGLKVSLSSWFREDRLDVRNQIETPEDFARVWITTLERLEREGLLDLVWFVDLCNEWAQSAWAPFLFADDADALSLSRRHGPAAAWGTHALNAVRAEFDIPLCLSVSDRLGEYVNTDDHVHADLLEPHVWMAQGLESTFYDQIGYRLLESNFDPEPYRLLAERAERHYRLHEPQWLAELSISISTIGDLARRTGKPLVTSEGWSLVNWRDGADLDWGWIKELNAFGVEAALSQGTWAAVATSNFCAPQFVGMWEDVAWHQRLTTMIHATPAPVLDARRARADVGG